MNKHKLCPFALFSVSGLIGSVILFSFMRFGPGVTADSVSYLETAKSLLNGDGFTVYLQPLTHFPPFYSILLAVGGLLPIRLITVSKLLQASIFGINLSLFLFTTWVGSKRNRFAPVAALLLFLTSTHIILVHSNVWSEGLFFLLGLLGIISLAYYLEFQDRRLLFLSAILIGLSILTRYAGLAFLPPVILFVLLQVRSSFRKKLIDSLLLSLIAILPLTLWMLRNLVLVNSTANRTFTYHPIQGKQFLEFFNTFSHFFLPSSIPLLASRLFTILFLAGLLVLTFVYLRIQRNQFKSASFYLVLLLFVYSIEYFIFIFISKTFIDAAIPLDARILFPGLTTLLAFVISIAFSLASNYQGKILVFSMLILILVLSVFQANRAWSLLYQMEQEGLNYQKTVWRTSQTIKYVRELSSESRIYTNGWDVIAFRTDFDPLFIPRKYSSTSLIRNEDYIAEMEKLCQDAQDGAIIVYFSRISRKYLPRAEEIEQYCELDLALVLEDGIIYKAGMDDAHE